MSQAGSEPADPTGEQGGERPLIEVVDLVKRYEDKTVLGGLSLRVERGDTVVILGGSGSGKSTFARLLLGLERPTSGHIFIEGVDIARASEMALQKVRHRFAMVFQKYALLDSLTVYDNVAFPLREHTHMAEARIGERVLTQLAELGLEAAARKLPGELSGGMAKRVGIARAMVMEPEILVYDEPTSGLDPITSRTVDELIERMREEHLVTSIVITHDMLTAYSVADRVILLARGNIAADARPEDFFTSRDEEIHTFVLSSGLDPEHLPPRRQRRSSWEIRAMWAARPPGKATGQ